MLRPIRDQVDLFGMGKSGKRRGATLSGRSMGYDINRCSANVATGGKHHTRYMPCGKEMVWSDKENCFVCPKHGPMMA